MDRQVPTANGNMNMNAYKVNITTIFKGKSQVGSLDMDPVLVHTYQNTHLCGIVLDYASNYMLAGSVMHSGLHVDRCDWISKWDELSEEMILGIKGEYVCSSV